MWYSSLTKTTSWRETRELDKYARDLSLSTSVPCVCPFIFCLSVCPCDFLYYCLTNTRISPFLLQSHMSIFSLSGYLSFWLTVCDSVLICLEKYADHSLSGRVSSERQKRVCSRETRWQYEHIFKNFNCPTREWAKWVSAPMNGASVAKQSAAEWVSGMSGANERT